MGGGKNLFGGSKGVGAVTGGLSGGVIGAIGGYAGGAGADKAAAAAQRAAMDQQRRAQQGYDRTFQLTDRPTAQSMAQMDQALQMQEKELGRQEQMIASIDPAIIEASQQALKLMRGEQSSTLQPLTQQRNMQRQKLLNQLREQLGPGAETSTAGIQALNRFDAETSNVFSNAQQQALQNLGGTAAQFSSLRPQYGQGVQSFGNLAINRSGIARDQAQTLNQAWAPVTGTAGAQFTRQQMQGMNQQAQGNQLVESMSQLLSGVGTKALTGGFGGGAPSAGYNPSYYNEYAQLNPSGSGFKP